MPGYLCNLWTLRQWNPYQVPKTSQCFACCWSPCATRLLQSSSWSDRDRSLMLLSRNPWAEFEWTKHFISAILAPHGHLLWDSWRSRAELWLLRHHCFRHLAPGSWSFTGFLCRWDSGISRGCLSCQNALILSCSSLPASFEDYKHRFAASVDFRCWTKKWTWYIQSAFPCLFCQHRMWRCRWCSCSMVLSPCLGFSSQSLGRLTSLTIFPRSLKN